MSRQIIQTSNAPAALGPYSQAVRHGDLVFLSGQVALDPVTGQLVGGGIDAQTRQVFRNLQAVCEAAGGSLEGVLKLNIFLTDLGNFATVNEIMAETFSAPYPARATVEVSALPLGAEVEMEAVLGL
ncbi:MAG: RidA family protein [Xanthomonadales bacterium]|jgi:reactive intermediate/imine deaminase|nr:RidA family protein [Xanthomonadales bacterium]